MYYKFFGLAEAPFNITPDSRFLFLSQRHREALGALVYGIKERKGFILLTGEIGAGKTTVCRALVHELKAENVRLALILNPGLSELELLKAVNDEFGIPSFYDTKKGLVDALNQFLIDEARRGQNVVLIIDEAQNLDPALLEQIRMLSNLETEDTKLIQIVLMGQPELNDTLSLTQLEQLNQRIAVRYHLTPLSEEEMQAYIRHRLFVARAKIDVEFTAGAVRMAYAATRGIPRRINVLMDRALLACYVDGSYTIDERIMAKAVQEIAGDSPQQERETRERRKPGAVLGSIFTRRVAIATMTAIAVLSLVTVGVALGVRLANVRYEQMDENAGEKAIVSDPKRGHSPKGAKAASARKDSGSSEETTDTADSKQPKAAPTPPPDWDQILKRQKNWVYEKNLPLVRVNNRRLAYRAAQLSILKAWGIAVDLSEMAKLSEEILTQGDFKSDKVKIRMVPIAGDYYQAIRLDIPLVVKLSNPGPNESEHVVLLQAQGEAVTVGDPCWGSKIYRTKEFLKKWDGAQALYVDMNQLGNLKKGDRSERVRALQEFLKQFLSSHDAKASGAVDISGLFDVKTTDAIRQFQSYYNLKDTGQLDDMTLMLLNSRMLRNGPRLHPSQEGF
ncbi:MAG: AAA family ATPase [Candidatus Sumerlaeaceae bacterium]